MSPDSVPLAAEIGGRMVMFVNKPIEDMMPLIENYRQLFRKHNPGHEVPAPMLIDFTYCHEDPEEVKQVAREYLAKYYLALDEHYEFSGRHFGGTKGYEKYAEDAAVLQEVGENAAIEAFIEAQAWGTPEQIIEKMRHRVEVAGDISALFGVSYAGMPYGKVQESLELLGTKVVPELKKLTPKN
jgi:alkanesulfonate monooxygenase SsuD/methylene tetrahydromethanopterin reductase-like flavin-dependent oxidoreductase (luciferase family)